jgi:hypothetical protein
MRKAFLSLVLLVTCGTVTPADEPLHLEWKKLQSSAAVLDPTAAQDKLCRSVSVGRPIYLAVAVGSNCYSFSSLY